MVPLDVAIQAAAVVISATFGVMVLAGAPRRAANGFLAGFLFLIAGNQAAESLRRFFPSAGESAWLYAGSVLAALDPFVLLYFVSIYPHRNALQNRGVLALVGVTSFGLALVAGWRDVLGVTDAQVWMATAAFTALVYTGLLLFMRRLVRADPDRPSLALLYPALALAAMPAWARVAASLVNPIARAGGDVAFFTALWLAGMALAAAALVFQATREGGPAGRTLLRGALVGGAVLALTSLPLLQSALASAPTSPGGHALNWAAVALRWVGFGLLVSMAVLRYDMLGMGIPARRRAARAVVAGTILLGAALLLASARTFLSGLGLTITELFVLGVVIVVSGGFRALVDRVAARVYGVPMPGDVAAALESYRRAATAAAEEGRGLDARLVRLRDELGLDPRAAGVVEAMVFERASPLAAGVTFAERYQVQRLLGRGGHASVFLARDARLGREVVLKEVRGAAAPDAVREARAASSLRHPNVIAVHDVLDAPGGCVLVGEFAPGGSIEERLRTHGRLDLDDGLRLLDGILAGLAAVHGAGIVHRDLKPANVLLDAAGTPKLADFGVARFFDEATPAVGARALVGTPAFLAPELRRGEPATAASDLYAVGLIARRCLRPPLPSQLEAVIARATAEAPADRFPSAAAMRAALAEAARGARAAAPEAER